jgi:rhomboid protease GluP
MCGTSLAIFRWIVNDWENSLKIVSFATQKPLVGESGRSLHMFSESLQKYKQIYSLDALTGAEFLIIAHHAARELNWTVHQLNQTSLLAYVPAGENAVGDEIQITIHHDKAYLQSESMTGPAPEADHHQKNIEKLWHAIEIAKNQLSPQEIAHQIEALQSTVQVDAESATPTSKPSDWFAFFIPSGDYFVTPILVNLNLLIFIAMVASGVGIFEPDNQGLLRWGANFKPYTLNGDWWRLLTNVFVHIGVLHLLVNMYVLVFIGSLLEPILGRVRFLIAYISAGVLASIVSLWWHNSTISAGASGAIFGMLGVSLAMLTTNHVKGEVRKPLLIGVSIFVIYSLLGGLRGGVDNAAHIGGLVAGIIIGYALYPSLRYGNKLLAGYSAVAGVVLMTIGAALVALQYVSDPISEYDRRMEDFYTRQTAALKIYNMPEGTPDTLILESIRDTGLVNWKANLKLIRELEQLDLPEATHATNKKMIEYCELRVKSYELMYKAFSENTNAYDNQMQVYDKRISNLINEINTKPEPD